MKKIIWILVLVLCLGLISANDGEYCYEQGSYYLSKGDIGQARTNFACAVSYLSGEEQEMAQEVLDMVNSLDSSSSRAKIIDHDEWFFIGEIDNEDSTTHIYYDPNGNSVTHTLFGEQIDFDEFFGSLEEISFTTRGAPGATNWVEGYESETYSPLGGITSYIFVWNCKGTGNIASITYSEGFDEYGLWDAIYVCPSSSFKWWYVLIILIIGGLGYFGYMNRDKLQSLPIDKYLQKIKKLLKIP
tara:strand:- start:2764 stop:3495 length:732 start_codon:yes stop_codon:yes gene_type:complete